MVDKGASHVDLRHRRAVPPTGSLKCCGRPCGISHASSVTGRRRMAAPLLEIHLLLRDIDLPCPANGEERRCAWAGPLQRLEILEQLAVRPFK